MNVLTQRAAVACLVSLVACVSQASASQSEQDKSAATAQATQHNAAGLTKAKNRDFEGAIAEYSEAIRLDPTFADAFRNRGLAEMNSNAVDDAIEDFSRAIALNARDSGAFYDRGLLLVRKRQFDRAIDDFSTALAINPTVAYVYEQRGLARTNSGDVDGGIADITAAIALDPRSARAYLNRGYSNSKKKDDSAALADYEQAIKLNPNYALAYSNRGEVKARLKDKVGAIADFTTALRLNPARATPYYYRGSARLTQGDYEGALADFTAFLDRTPKHADALTGRCQARREKGELELALADCDAAVAASPVNARALSVRGEVKAMRGDTGGALSDLSEALSLDPKDARARYQRCRLEAANGDLAGALTDCTEAIAVDTTLAGAYFERAAVRERQGDATGADQDFAQAHALDPKLQRPRALVSGTGTGSASSLAGMAVGGVYRSGNGVSTPRVTREQRPQYTSAALEQGIEGSVLLECVVRPDGTVGEVKVSRSLDPVYGLDTAAINAVRQWTFEPATKNGQPVAALISVELSFTIGNHAAPAPFALPVGFAGSDQDGPLSSTDSWQEQTFDQAATRIHVAYPKGWVTMTGVAPDVIMLQNPREPFGVALMPSAPGAVRLDHTMSEPELQELAAVVAKNSGRPVVAVGQVRSRGRLWFWLDFGELSIAKVDQSATGPSTFASAFVDASRAWLFVTVAGGRLYEVAFLVERLQNTSESELQRLTATAGPLFAKFLERLSFEPR